MLLIDDGSVDGSLDLCYFYAEIDDRIKVIHKENGGANSARNQGIDAAQGDYICLIDSDDCVVEQYLETINNCIAKSPIMPDLIIIDYNTNDGRKYKELEMEEGYYNRSSLDTYIFPLGVIRGHKKYYHGLIPNAPWQMIYRIDLLRKHCCRDYSIKIANDIAFTFECAYASESIYVCAEELYIYNVSNNDSLQRGYHPDLLLSIASLFRYWNNHLISMHDSLPYQIKVRKNVEFRQALIKYIKLSPSMYIASKDLKKSVEESNILYYMDADGLPLMFKLRIWLIRKGLYTLCLTLQSIMCKLKSIKCGNAWN